MSVSTTAEPSLRDDFLAAFRFCRPARIPRFIDLTPAKLEEFRQKTGRDDPQEYFKQAHRMIAIQAGFKDALQSQNSSGTSDMELLKIPTRAGSLYHYVEVLHPMVDFQTASQVRAYQFPDYASMFDEGAFARAVSSIQQRGLAAVGDARLIFTLACYLRGMEGFLCDLHQNQALAETLLDRLTELSLFKARACTRAGVDALFVYEDVASQRGMLMSPQMWRIWLKPRMAKVIAAARQIRPDLPVLYDSDGDMTDIIDGLLEIGVNAISPMQPECMDLDSLHRRYGGRLVFWGTIGVQQTMPFGTPADVREAVRHSIRTYSREGGLIIGPAHVISPDIPWSNVMAFYEAVAEFKYAEL